MCSYFKINFKNYYAIFLQELFIDQTHLRDDSELTSTGQPTKCVGYRRIEDWHEENKNERHVLTHLKQEQAKWAMKFEDLGGDGI